MNNKFTDILRAEAVGETIDMRPSPYIKHDALVVCSGRRGADLCRALSGTPASRDGRQFHLTAARAHKCFALFSTGFSAVLHGADEWRFTRNGGPGMELHEAMRCIKSL